mgnify:CR=1 FL=1
MYCVNIYIYFVDVGIQLNKSEHKVQVGLGKNNPNRPVNTGNRKKKGKK